MRKERLFQTVGHPTIHIFGEDLKAGLEPRKESNGATQKSAQHGQIDAQRVLPEPQLATPSLSVAEKTENKTRKPTFQEAPKAVMAPAPEEAEPAVQTLKPVTQDNKKPVFKEAPIPTLAPVPEEAEPAVQTLKPVTQDNKKPVFKEAPVPTLAPAPVAKGPAVTVAAAEKFLEDQVNDFLDKVNTYLGEYNTRFGSRNGDLTDAYVGDSQDYLNLANQKTVEFSAASKVIRAFLSKYGNQIDPAWAAEVVKMLDHGMVQVNQVLEFAKQDNEYWSSWGKESVGSNSVLSGPYAADSEDNIGQRRYQRAQKEYGFQQKYAEKTGVELLNLINFIDDEDEKAWVTGEALRILEFDEANEALDNMRYEYNVLVALGPLINHYQSGMALDEEQLATAKSAVEQRAEIFAKYGISDLDGLKELISRNEQLIAQSQKVQEYMRLSSVRGNKDFEEYVKIGREEADAYNEENKKTQHMTATEIKILAYYIAKDKENGTNLAEQYKEAIKNYLKHRRAEEIADNINGMDIPVIEGLTRIGYGFGSGVVNWATDVAQNFTDKKLEPTTMELANGYIGSDPSLNRVDRVLHKAATTTGYIMPTLVASRGVGSGTGVASVGRAVGSAAMFLGSAGNAYGEALEKGHSNTNARIYSVLVGASEVALQNVLGGISEFGGLPEKLDGKIDAIKNALLKGAAKYGVRLGGEILEEELQNYLEPAIRSIVLGEKYDMPTVQQIIDTALTTFITTSTVEGPKLASETIREPGNNALKAATEPVKPEQLSPKAPETKEVAKIGWDGRVAVTEANGPNVTVDGKTYALIGKDANGSPVYQDVEVLKEQTAEEPESADQKESPLKETEMEENPEWFAAAIGSAEAASADSRDNLTSVAKGHIMDLQSGFMCFPEGDPLIENTKNVTPKEGFFDVAMHGSPTAVAFGGREANMSPRLLAEVIRHNPNYHGENIRLLCCSTGLQVDGAYCFAEELANALGVTVEAPNMEVYTDVNGNITVGRFDEGQMIEYRPNERGRIK